MVPILLLLVPPLRYGEGQCCPNISRRCRRYAALFTAVGAAFETTARVTAPSFVGRWCRRYASHFAAASCAFDTTAKVTAARLSTVGVGVMLPVLLLFMPSLILRLGYLVPVFRPFV